MASPRTLVYSLGVIWYKNSEWTNWTSYVLTNIRFLWTFQELDKLGATLVVGRRTNVRWNSEDFIYHPVNVTLIARQRGRLYDKGADYFFIARNALPWHCIPDFVIARDGYDNFLVATAITNSVSVIDSTATILAVHQTDQEGNLAGGRNRADRRFNKQLIRQFLYYTGHTKLAPYATVITSNESGHTTSIVVVEKRKLKRKKNICYLCNCTR